MPRTQIEDLLKAGAHFGHLTSRWNPKMAPFLFMERSGIHILDLKQTQTLLDEAADAAARFSQRGKEILFVGTKKQAQEVVTEEAKRCGMPYVTERWLGGMLTNFQTIRKSIRRMEEIDRQEQDGTLAKLKKKERLMRRREREKLERTLSGIASMNKLPAALFVVDVRREHIAVNEARKLDIPVIALLDSNCDPDLIDFPIPANDDAMKSIALFTRAVSDAVLEGRKAREAKRQAEKAEEEARKAEKEARKAEAEKAKAEKAKKEAKKSEETETEEKNEETGTEAKKKQETGPTEPASEPSPQAAAQAEG